MNVVDEPFGVVLLIGGCGCLGFHLTEDLLRHDGIVSPANIHVFDLDVASGNRFRTNRLPPENFHAGDISDTPTLSKFLEQIKPTVIFDLVSPRMFNHDLSAYMSINEAARRRLLDCARRTQTVKAYVYTSSAGVIHDSNTDLRHGNETLPLLYMPQQKEPYSHSKAVAEALVLSANGLQHEDSGDWKMLTAAVRPVSVIADGHPVTTVPIIEMAKAGKYKFQVGDGKNLSDWVYVDNVTRAHLLVAQALIRTHRAPASTSSDQRVDGEAFLITNDQPVPFWHFVRSLGAAAGYPTHDEDITVIPKQVGLAMAFCAEWWCWITTFGRTTGNFTRGGIRYSCINRYFDIDKAKERLHYRPLVSVEEGIQRATASYRNETRKTK